MNDLQVNYVKPTSCMGRLVFDILCDYMNILNEEPESATSQRDLADTILFLSKNLDSVTTGEILPTRLAQLLLQGIYMSCGPFMHRSYNDIRHAVAKTLCMPLIDVSFIY